MDTISLSENDRNKKKHSKTQQLENKTVSDNNEETFPWLLEFNKSVCSSAGNRNYQHLKRLLLFYTQNILSSMETSNVKFDDEINLKDNINNILIFFHLYWLDIKQEIADHSLYLNKMSALLSVYINVELRISRKKNVKILAALYTYLNNSEEHIFRVLLRIKHMTKKCTQICSHIFVKSFANLKIKRTSLTDITYIRYLLVFKMWKKIEKLSDKKEKVDELALKLLGPHMPKLRDELLEFVPRPPIDRKDETLWLLQSNSFNLEQVHKNFLLFEDKMDEHFPLCEDQIDKHSLLPEDGIDNSADLQCTKAVYLGQKNCLKSQKYEFLKQMDLLHRSNPNRSNLTSNQEKNKDLNSLQNNNMPLGIKRKSSEQIYLPKKKKRGLKSKKVKKKKEEESRKVIIIDLTGDDEISVPCKRKKIKHNLKFLKIMKDIIKNKKHINTLKHSSKFITSVNTEKSSNRNRKNTTENVLEHKFNLNSKISDNKSYTSISNKYSLNTNFPKREHLKFDQDKESKIMTNVLKGSKPENDVSSHMTCMTENAIDLYNNTMTQKETLTSEEQMDTIPYGPLLKMCQSDIVDFFKQEIPITNCDAMQSYSWKMSQIVCHQLNKCEDCKKIYSKSFIFPDSTTQEHSTFTKNDVKACGNIVYIKSNTRCVIMPHNDDIVTCCDMHKKEEKMQCQHDSNDMYTTFTEDQIKSSLDNQNINLDDKRKHGSKHSETAIKPQQAKSDCDILLSNDQLPPTEHFFSYIDSEYSNMDSKEANEIMETYCNGDLLLSETISSFDNQIGILEILENMSNKTTNFFQQSPFESDHIHTNTFLSEKDILCNNQNNAINATVNSITFE